MNKIFVKKFSRYKNNVLTFYKMNLIIFMILV